MKSETFTSDCSSTNERRDDFKYDDNESFDSNMLRYRGFLTEFEQKKFDFTRQTKYWWTYTTCIFYGLVAIIFLLIGGLTTYGNNILFNELYIFMMTYIIGTIFIIIILVYKVYSFNFPETRKEITSDALYCPDYWDSSLIKRGLRNSVEDGKNTHFFGKKNTESDFNLECQLKADEGIYNSNSLVTGFPGKYKSALCEGDNCENNTSKIYVDLERDVPGVTGLSNETGEYEHFRKIAASMAGYTYTLGDGTTEATLEKNNANALKNSSGEYFDEAPFLTIPLVCDKVYPLYMAKKDFEYSKENRLTSYNKFRCAYSKACGIPWTEVGCS